MKRNLLIRKTKTHYLIEFDERDKIARLALFDKIPGFEITTSESGAFRVPAKYKLLLIEWANDNFDNSEIVERGKGGDVIRDFLTNKAKAVQPELSLKMS